MEKKDPEMLIQMIEPAPACLNISREAWARTPAVVRDDTRRMVEELSESVPIQKDIRAGRVRRHGKFAGPNSGKRQLNGFWELHCCEADPTPSNLARAAQLRELLAPEIARWQMVEDLEPYHQMAAKSGTTLAAALSRYVGFENLMRADPTKAIENICATLGVDPLELAARVLAEPDEAVA